MPYPQEPWTIADCPLFHAAGTVTQNYGPSPLAVEPPYGGYENYHRGIDVVGPYPGCPVYAVQPGTVVAFGRDPTGNYLKVLRRGFVDNYWHVATFTCRVGQEVDTTTQLATEGNTGGVSSTGYHVHYEVTEGENWQVGLLKQNPTDPTALLTQQGGTDANDMNAYQIAQNLYSVLDPSYAVPAGVLKDKAEKIAETGSIIPVLHDLLGAKPWRSPEEYELSALEAYAVAKAFPNPKQYAYEKVSGGDKFASIIASDLASDKADYTRLKTLYEAMVQQNQVLTQSVRDLQEKLAAVETGETPAPAQTQPVEQVPDPTTVDPPKTAPTAPNVSLVSFLYELLSRAFLGH